MISIKNSKILVTGGAGFIGGHLVKEILSLGANVIVVDIEVKKHSFFEREKLGKKVKLEFVDVSNKQRTFEIIKFYNPSYIFHLAAQTLVTEAYNNPCQTFNANIMGTVNILEAVRTLRNIRGVIAASSDKAYGKTKKAYTEDSPLKGDYPYDVSKSSMDLICQSYFITYNLPIVIARFGNVYGEGDLHFDRIIPGICKAVINNEMLDIRSDGTYIRDYLYVKDVVEGYLFLLKNFNRIKGEAFNFSSRDTLSVFDVVKKTEKILKVKIPYKILNTAKNEIPYQHLNDDKVRKLGWKNKYDLDSSLEGVLKSYETV